ncbi:MAG: hypothetical protein UX89_C0010G0007 [Parcubacteria group bacterium GW2011_GWA2_47_16]|nr:MAG: hypothetical protein UX89_C0010G0007 [Parcubacteria group bacterium GW2011_GWA2_47_16]
MDAVKYHLYEHVCKQCGVSILLPTNSSDVTEIITSESLGNATVANLVCPKCQEKYSGTISEATSEVLDSYLSRCYTSFSCIGDDD